MIPFLKNNGQRVKVHHLLRCLSRAYDLSCVFPYAREEDVRGKEAYELAAEVNLVRTTKTNSGREIYLRNLIGRFVAAGVVREVIEGLLASGPYDVAWLEYGYLGQYAAVFQSRGVPVVYGTHNAEARLFKELWARERSLVRRIGRLPILAANFIHERVYFPRMDVLACISGDDAEYYANWVDAAKLRVLPNFRDVPPPPQQQEERPSIRYIAMVGGLDALQNREGLEFFLDEVWPKVHSRDPLLALRVIGRMPRDRSDHERIVAVANRVGGVTFAGEVEETEPHVQGALMTVVPILRGSGTRTKIVESVACSVPVVSTLKGAEGLPFRDGESIAIADDARSMADKITALAGDEAARSSMASQARRIFDEELGYTPNLLRIHQIVEAAISRGTPTRPLHGGSIA